MRYLILLLLFAVSYSPIFSQAETSPGQSDTTDVSEEAEYDEPCTFWSIDLPVSTAGISVGNSSYFNGIRFNVVDCGVEQINGVNITFWQPRKTSDAEINGISLGIAPVASRFRGINLGLAALVSNEHSYGINIGLLASVSSGDQVGFNLGGLAVVTEGDMSFINIGGLAMVSQGNAAGFNFGGLATVSEGNKAGFTFGGLANVAEGNMYGVNIAGLANVSESNVYGLNIAGLAQVAGHNLYGFTIAGLAIVSESIMSGVGISLGKIQSGYSITGVHLTGYKIETQDLTGINGSIAWIEADYMKGLGISVFNQIRKRQVGLTIGLLNIAEVLQGVQIGIINIAENNPAPFRILPIINAHF